MAWTVEGFLKEVELAKALLQPGEQVLQYTDGLCESYMMGNSTKRNGVLLATDRRVVIYVKKMVGYELEEFPYSTMSSIEMSKGLFGYSMKFIASNNTTKVTMMSRGNPEESVRFVRARIGTRPSELPKSTSVATKVCKCGFDGNEPNWKFCGSCGQPFAQRSNSTSEDVIAGLERLAGLLEKGLLTQAEFERAKAKLLA